MKDLSNYDSTRHVDFVTGERRHVPSFFNWMFKVLLLVALFLLVLTVRALWPDTYPASWGDVIAIGSLATAALGVGIWTLGAWTGEA